MYVVICMYLLARNRPIWAALFLTLSLSVKAGAVLLVPSFFGWIHYHYGTQNLAAALLVVVLFQAALMLPLCFDPFARMIGFQGGGTHWMDYLKYSKLLGGDKDRPYGSDYQWSIYWSWQMVSEKTYYNDAFFYFLKISMLMVNVYYFFIKMQTLPKCLDNLFSSFDSKFSLMRRVKLTWRHQRVLLTLMMVCYLAGAQFVPGGHQQFQMWYWDLLPMMIEMVGLPSVLTFKLFHDIYPCDIRAPAVHHYFSICLSMWLLFYGPDHFKKIFKNYI